MNRIHDAFEDLISRHPQGDPDAILASARHDATSARSRGRTRLALAAAAIVLVAAASAGAIVVIGDESGEQVQAGQGPGSTTAPATDRTVSVFFTKDEGDGCKRVEEVRRPVIGSGPFTPEEQVTAALRGLLDGPTEAEAARGLTSPFNDDSKTLRSVTTANEITYIDFDRTITNTTASYSTTCVLESIQAQFSATLSSVEGLSYRHLTIEGDSAAFYAWLGTEPPKEGPSATTTDPSPEAAPGSEGFDLSWLPPGAVLVSDLAIPGVMGEPMIQRTYAIGTADSGRNFTATRTTSPGAVRDFHNLKAAGIDRASGVQLRPTEFARGGGGLVGTATLGPDTITSVRWVVEPDILFEVSAYNMNLEDVLRIANGLEP